MTDAQTNNQNRPTLYAYSVTDNENGKAFWTRIGAAWPNKDGGFSIQLTCLPISGRIVCQPPKTEDA